MKYFSKVHAQSAQNYDTTFYIVLDEDNTDHKLTKEILLSNNQYKEFAEKKENRRKDIYVDYAVYSTEEEVNNAMHNDAFEEIITSDKAKYISQSEIAMRKKSEKNKNKRKAKKKVNPIVLLLAFIGVCGIALGSFAAGKKFTQSKAVETIPVTSISEDGMIIPLQDQVSEDSDTITITIDRSYSTTPTEDLQLKGEIENGEAKITLPEFDRTDFFTHVQGYTWGFTSDPEGKKIQYYGGKTYSFKEDTKLYRVLVKYGGGSGTKDDPYLINYYDQLELIGEEKARGYFKQTEDLWFPDYATHKPIDTINELKSDPDSEVFMYDGGNFQISNLTSPLFGQVSGAVIKNVNIANSHISSPEHKDLGFIVCNAYNYIYTSEDGKKYTTGDTVIDHCTVIDSSIYTEYTDSLAQEEAEDEEEETTDVSVEVIAPDVIEYDEKGHVIEQKTIEKEPTKKAECCVGAISGVGADIRNCYVYNFYFTNSLDDYYLYVGGLSGKPTNVLNSAICSFSAGGKIFNAGGIAGNCSGSRMYDANGKETADYYGGNIQGCAVRYPYFSTEVSCGGIVGEGGTNVKNAVISNNYCIGATFVCGVTDEKGILSKTGSIGGVIGTDGKSKYGHLITNTVSPSDFNVIGTKMLSKYDDSVRLAPYYAYFQDNIKLVINANTIAPDDPKEIYTGDFMFSDANVFGESEYGALAYPSSINDILTRIAAEYAEEEDYGE